MRTKFIALLALTLCMSAFLLPMTAHAATDNERPTVTANIEGEVLQITASGGSIGVEAIFINNERFNFRVDGVLSVNLLGFRNSEEIEIYAVDFAGTHSDVVTISNPHYIDMSTQNPSEGIPVTSSNPFTPDGQASVTDNATSHDEKEFFTFTTPSGNVFFLVVDRQRDSDNVYFLNAVTEQDLIALAEQNGTEMNTIGDGGIPVSTTPQNSQEQEPNDTEPVETDPPVADSGGGNGAMIFLLVAVVIGGGVGYYIKIVRPKQQGNGDYDDEDEDEEDIGEELELPDEDEDDYDYPTEEGEPETEDE